MVKEEIVLWLICYSFRTKYRSSLHNYIIEKNHRARTRENKSGKCRPRNNTNYYINKKPKNNDIFGAQRGLFADFKCSMTCVENNE